MIENGAYRSLLKTNDKYLQLIKECDDDKKTIETMLNNIKEGEHIRRLEATVVEYTKNMEERKKALISIQNTIVAHEEIKTIIENLKLDTSNLEHLEFWHAMNYQARRGSSAMPDSSS